MVSLPSGEQTCRGLPTCISKAGGNEPLTYFWWEGNWVTSRKIVCSFTLWSSNAPSTQGEPETILAKMWKYVRTICKSKNLKMTQMCTVGNWLNKRWHFKPRSRASERGRSLHCHGRGSRLCRQHEKQGREMCSWYATIYLRKEGMHL